MTQIYQNLEELAQRIRKHQQKGERVVLVNGCFDVLHGGHVSYLQDARRHGDVLVCGVNSDASIARIKGKNRPICTERERLSVLSSLPMIDYLIVFGDETCEQLLRVLRPDVHAKGTDYTAENVPERAISDELGIETVITGDPKENATKTMIAKARSESA